MVDLKLTLYGTILLEMNKMYPLTHKEITEERKRFSKTAYGKMVCVLAYAITVISLLLATILTVISMRDFFSMWVFGPIALILLFVAIISFFLGSIYYYNKLERFIEVTKKK